MKNDPVRHPSHYTRGRIETKDFIRDHNLNFNRGSAIKYIYRAGFKDPKKEIEDLEKAIQFLQFEIDYLREYPHFYIKKCLLSVCFVCYLLAKKAEKALRHFLHLKC